MPTLRHLLNALLILFLSCATSFAAIDYDVRNNLHSFLFVNGTTGNVGLGTTVPLSKLHVVGAGTAAGISFQIDNSLYVPNFTVLDNGNVGIGISAPTAKLAVDGSVYVLDGSFGIGTISPRARMDISGGFTITGQATVGSFSFSSGTTTVNAITTDIGSGGSDQQIPTAAAVRSFVSGGGSTIIHDVDTSVYVIDGTQARIGFNINGSTNMIMDQNGNVGIGTISPAAVLDIAAVAAAPSRIVKIGGSFADLAGTRTGLYTDVTAPDAGAGLAAGSWSEVRTTSNAGTYVNAVTGVYAEALHSGSATADYLIGALTLANQTGSGTVTNAYGLYPQVWKGAGTITNAYGLYYEGVPNINGDTMVSTGTVVNQYGLAFKNLTQGTTRNIGIFLDDNVYGPAATGNFAIYSETTYQNYFAGNIGVGTTAANAQLVLHSTGAPVIDTHWNDDTTAAAANESHYYVGQTGAPVRTTPGDVQTFRFFAGSGAFQEVVNINVNTPSMSGPTVIGAVDFKTQDSSAALVTRMKLTDQGAVFPQKVGVGTISPSASLDVAGTVAFSPGSVMTVTAAGGVSTLPRTYIQIVGQDAVTDVAGSASPQILAGATGQVLYLQGTDDTHMVKFGNGNGLVLSDGVSFTMGARDLLVLIYNGTSWLELSRTDN